MATSADGTVTGQVETVGATTEDPTLHAQHAENPAGTTPAPGATPDGALAYFVGDDGSDAWLAGESGNETGAPAATDGAPDTVGTTPDATANPAVTPDTTAGADQPTTLTGYLRRVNAEPIRYDDVARWAADVDALGMREVPPPDPNQPQAADPNAQPTAPAAPPGPAPVPAVKGKVPPQLAGHQFQSGSNPKQDAGNGKPPAIDRGSFVQLGTTKGRVDLIVTNGTVPGVDGDVEGSTDSPAARVVVWEKDGSGWKATGRKIASSVARLKRIPPLQTAGSKALDDVWDMHVLHEAAIEDKALPAAASVGPDAVEEVFNRGVRSWPGFDTAGCGPEEWGKGRVEAFLAKAAGADIDGYHRDDDLLRPADSPSPLLTPGR